MKITPPSNSLQAPQSGATLLASLRSRALQLPYLLSVVVVSSLAGISERASGQTDYTWIGGNGGDWDVGSNWVDEQKPGGTGTAVFNNPNAVIANAIADQRVRSITFSNIAGPISFGSLTGSRLILSLGGTLSLSSASLEASGALTINAPLVIGALNDTVSGRYTITSNVNRLGAPYLVIAGAISGGTTGNVELIINGQSRGPNVITGLISDGNSNQLKVHKNSSEEWSLENVNNTFSGGVTIENGRLKIASIGLAGAASSIGSGATIGFQNQSGTIIYTGAGETSDKSFTSIQKQGTATFEQAGTGHLKFTGGIRREATEGSSSFVLKGSTSGVGEIAGEITQASGGTLGITKEGTGKWVLSGTNNSHSGITSIREGTLSVEKIGKVGENSSLGQHGEISMGYLSYGYRSVLHYTGTGETTDKAISIAADRQGKIVIDHSGVGLLKFTADLKSSGSVLTNTLTFQGSNSGIGEFAGAIVNGTNTNVTAVEKEGTGTWILSGESTYTGHTSVKEGVLVIAGSLDGTAKVEVAGKLASSSSGSITMKAGGGVDILAGGVLAPGGDGEVGMLSVSLSGGGKLAFKNGSTLAVEIGSGTDRIVFGATGDWLAGGGVGTTLALSLGAGFSYTESYTIFENVATANFAFESIAGYDDTNYKADFVQVGDTYQVQFAAVPEPSIFACIALGLGLFFVYSRVPRSSDIAL